jgi:glycosyltransferase involved in cell wall biosynthesis
MPLVTVIITTFNRRPYLAKAVQSVIDQTFNDFELIILDNNSVDGTDLLIQSLDDKRIKYLRHTEMPISKQRNLGISIASGKYVSFLDDDDMWLPFKLESQINVFRKSSNDTCLVFSGFIFYNDSGREWGAHTPKDSLSFFNDLISEKTPFSGSASNPMLNVSIVKSVNSYNEDVLCGEDWELYLRLSEKHPISIDKNLCVKIRQHNGLRLGQNLFGALKLERMIFFKYQKILKGSLQTRLLQKIAGKYIRLGRLEKGRRILFLALNKSHLNLIVLMQYIFSFLSLSFYNKLTKVYNLVRIKLLR